MSKIFISTNRDSANVCFGRGEGGKQTKFNNILLISTDLPIQQFGNTQVYLHLDFTNPKFEIDKNNDLLLFHSQTGKFKDKFTSIFSKYSNHPGKFKEAFEILIDDTITDKFNAIKSVVFPNISSQIMGQIGGQFLEIGGIDQEQIKSLIGDKYTKEIDEIINQNIVYQQKKSNKAATKEDEKQNIDNWYVLEKALNASNGK